MHTIIAAVSPVVLPDVAVGVSGVGQATGTTRHGVVSSVNLWRQISMRTSERGPRPQQRQDGNGPRLHRNRRSHNNIIIASRVQQAEPRGSMNPSIDVEGVR